MWSCSFPFPWHPGAAASRNSPRPSKTVSASGPRALLMGRFSPWKAACAWSFPVPLSGMAAVFLPVPGPRRRPPWPPEIRAQKEAPGGSTPLRSLSFFSPQRCYPELRRRGWAARHLIGLGPGLTPAGDDFLGGYLAGRFAQSPGGSRDSGVLFFSLLLPYAGENGISLKPFIGRRLPEIFRNTSPTWRELLSSGGAQMRSFRNSRKRSRIRIPFGR